MTPRKPNQSLDRSDSHNVSARGPVTLQDLMSQLKSSSMATHRKLEQIWSSTDRKLDHIRSYFTEVHRNFAAVEKRVANIRAEVSELSVSHGEILG